MSILSSLFRRKITFDQAATQGAAWFAQVEAKLPAEATAALGAGLSNFKQAASNAIALADTALGPFAATLVTAIETEADAALLAITGGAAAPLVPAVNAGIDHIIAAGKAALDAKAMEWKAKLTTVGAPPLTPPQ